MQCGESFYEEEDSGNEPEKKSSFSFGATVGGCLLFAIKSIFLVALGIVVGWLIIFVI
jgi:hypothetical protein